MSAPTSPNWFNEEYRTIAAAVSPRITTLRQIRSILEPIESEELEISMEDDDVFSMFVFHNPSKPDVVTIFGHASCRTDKMFAGAAAMCIVELRQSVTAAEVEQAAKALAYWAIHPVYDYAAMKLLQNVAGHPDFNGVTPPLSPEVVEVEVINADALDEDGS